MMLLQVSQCKSRSEKDSTLHTELYELLREGMAGNLPTGSWKISENLSDAVRPRKAQ